MYQYKHWCVVVYTNHKTVRKIGMALEASKNKKHLHTTISAESFDVLQKLAHSRGSIGKVIEEAVELAHIRESMADNSLKGLIQKSKLDEYRLSHLMLNDFRMMAVGRRTFLSYIETLPEAPIRENNAIELIEWFYDNKFQIDSLSLGLILEAIKSLWIAGKYFTGVQIQPQDEQEVAKARKFKVIFSHDFNEKKYGEYWTQYFTYVLGSPPINAKIDETAIRNQSFNMTIAQAPLLRRKRNE